MTVWGNHSRISGRHLHRRRSPWHSRDILFALISFAGFLELWTKMIAGNLVANNKISSGNGQSFCRK